MRRISLSEVLGYLLKLLFTVKEHLSCSVSFGVPVTLLRPLLIHPYKSQHLRRRQVSYMGLFHLVRAYVSLPHTEH